MYVCMYACIYPCMYVCICICKAFQNLSQTTCVSVCMYACMYACMYVRIYDLKSSRICVESLAFCFVFFCVCMHTCLYACVLHTYMCVCMYLFTWGFIRVRMYHIINICKYMHIIYIYKQNYVSECPRVRIVITD